VRKKQLTNYPQAVLIGVAIGILLVLITPRCEKATSGDVDRALKIEADPSLTFVIDSMRAEGYSVENHFPIYIRFIKHRVSGNAEQNAISIAKALREHTGIDVNVQVDCNNVTYFADHNGIIDPQKAVRPH